MTNVCVWVVRSQGGGFVTCLGRVAGFEAGELCVFAVWTFWVGFGMGACTAQVKGQSIKDQSQLRINGLQGEWYPFICATDETDAHMPHQDPSRTPRYMSTTGDAKLRECDGDAAFSDASMLSNVS